MKYVLLSTIHLTPIKMFYFAENKIQANIYQINDSTRMIVHAKSDTIIFQREYKFKKQ